MIGHVLEKPKNDLAEYSGMYEQYYFHESRNVCLMTPWRANYGHHGISSSTHKLILGTSLFTH